jgi:YidC/Oxa1 family membrane protein insertase
MNNQRLLLVIALSFILLLLWQEWQKDYGPRPPPPPEPSTTSTAVESTPSAPPQPAVADVPVAPSTGEAPSPDLASPVPALTLLKSTQPVRVNTDVLHVQIDRTGGDIRRLFLPKYPQSIDNPKQAFLLMNDTLPNLFVAQSGLLSSSGAAPNHHAVFTAEHQEYVLQPGQDSLAVRLVWKDPSGLQVDKVYRFQRGSYVVELTHEVKNGSAKPWSGRNYSQFQRTQVAEPGQSSFIHTYMGGAIYNEADKYTKIDFADMVDSDLNLEFPHGWAAMIQHYFLGAWIPPAEQTDRYYTKVLSHARYVLGLISPSQTIEPGQTRRFSVRLFAGPKLQDQLDKVAKGLELTVDYGVLTVLSQPLFWLLDKLHRIFGNWGWAIIILTLLIKLAFYKLSETSYRSMANMRRLQPKIQALRERYSDDRQRMNQAMMELYKKEKINPLGGCLPIVVQIPVFIALYWVLLGSVELRQAPFILWIHDLSTKDPYYVLPILMGISMFLQQRLNPAPMDPIQQKVMMFLPFVFTVFFAFFPAGLVLYWLVNNVLSIAQQWAITRRIEAAAKSR